MDRVRAGPAGPGRGRRPHRLREAVARPLRLRQGRRDRVAGRRFSFVRRRSAQVRPRFHVAPPPRRRGGADEPALRRRMQPQQHRHDRRSSAAAPGVPDRDVRPFVGPRVEGRRSSGDRRPTGTGGPVGEGDRRRPDQETAGRQADALRRRGRGRPAARRPRPGLRHQRQTGKHRRNRPFRPGADYQGAAGPGRAARTGRRAGARRSGNAARPGRQPGLHGPVRPAFRRADRQGEGERPPRPLSRRNGRALPVAHFRGALSGNLGRRPRPRRHGVGRAAADRAAVRRPVGGGVVVRAGRRIAALRPRPGARPLAKRNRTSPAAISSASGGRRSTTA